MVRRHGQLVRANFIGRIPIGRDPIGTHDTSEMDIVIVVVPFLHVRCRHAIAEQLRIRQLIGQ